VLKRILFVLLCALPLTAHADAIAKLKHFIAATRSGQADFTQVVRNRDGQRLQSASGIMQFMRPGKFRWEYRKPYEQLIVGDGQKFWLYDADLNQVTVKKLDNALGSSPAALLSGSNAIERGFKLQDIGERNGLDWLEAVPKTQDTSFESIRMGFDTRDELAVMELRDNFGQVTVLRFLDMQRNPRLSPSLFKFAPPPDADVLGDE
jgi:outer membrane lipoprotein carrier protein